MSSYTGDERERPITSDRADRLPALLCYEGATPEEALARGWTTLRAVAVVYYGGDIQAARTAIYGQQKGRVA